MPKPSPNDDFESNPEEGPPEPYNTWKEYFGGFDRQLEESPRITVRGRIDNPKIRPSNEIPDSELEEELFATPLPLKARDTACGMFCVRYMVFSK